MESIKVTLNPDNLSIGNTLSNGNLTLTNLYGFSIKATVGKSSGKWYWEVKFNGGNTSSSIGVASNSYVQNSAIAGNTALRVYSGSNGYKYPEGILYGAAWRIGDIIGIALDLDNYILEFFKNGTSMGISHTDLQNMGEVCPLHVGGGNGDTKTVTFNFGAVPFTYSPPNGFNPYTMTFSDRFVVIDPENNVSCGAIFNALVPKLNSNTGTNGTAISSSAYYDNIAWRSFDDDYTTKYISSFVPTATSPVYIGYKFNPPTIVRRYEFIAGLVDFKFLCSNDGVNWKLLDERTNQKADTANIKSFGVVNSDPYIYYKLETTKATTISDRVGISMVQFYSSVPVLINTVPIESDYIKYGYKKRDVVNLEDKYNSIKLKTNSIEMGSGKVFKQRLDTSKILIKKVTIT
ncbi:UNVERIFIED_CONTAM: hypothetical protein ABIC26_002827 [Paenibacillus sp. PvR008]